MARFRISPWGFALALVACVITGAGCGSSQSPSAASSSAATTRCESYAANSYSRAVMSDSPTAYFRLDDSSGPTMSDSSPSANNGTYAAGVRFGVPGAMAGDSAVAAVTPSSGIGTGGPSSGLTGDHNFTLEAWFCRTGTVQDQSLVSMGQPGEGNIAGLSTWISNTGNGTPSQLVLDLYVGVANAGSLPIWDTRTVNVNLWNGQWHYLAITYSATADKVTGYVDGHDLGSLTPVTAINLLPNPIRVGYWVDTYINQNVIGDMDDVAVYPTALSPARIEAHFVASRRSLTSASG